VTKSDTKQTRRISLGSDDRVDRGQTALTGDTVITLAVGQPVEQASAVSTILQTIGSLLAGAIAAGLGWAATEFLARPVRRFYDLRGEIIQKMAHYGNVRASHKEAPDGGVIENTPLLHPTEQARLEEAQLAIRDLSTRMRAFAYNEALARRTLMLLRYDPLKASDGLMGYSNYMNISGAAKASKKKMVEDALHIPEHTL
jgi:hypothetical protein